MVACKLRNNKKAAIPIQTTLHRQHKVSAAFFVWQIIKELAQTLKGGKQVEAKRAYDYRKF
jgi:hypothetical protein